MLRSILVPLDGSTFSESSLPLASRIAKATGASLHLAHVHVPYEPDQLLANTQFQYEGVNVAEYDAQYREKEKKYLSSLEKRLSDGGTPVDAELLDGRPIAERLADYADAVDTDMIFITSHGHSGVNRVWLGSVADEMIRHTHYPLLVIQPKKRGGAREEAPPVGHIVVPLDGSALAESVLSPVSDLARATGARVTLVHAVVVPGLFGGSLTPVSREGLQPKLEAAKAYLEETAAALREKGLDVSIHVTHGRPPAVAVAELADQLGADLIGLATHGFGGLRRALVGSVADKLLRASTLPLLVMRPAAEA